MLISEAFAKFGAIQKNVQWSVSAVSESNELVVSLWNQFFEKRSKDTMTYIDKVSRWSGAGNNEFTAYLEKAFRDGLPVRAIIAKSKQPEVIAAGGAASNLGNTFHPKTDWIGEITEWDGDKFEIEFRLDK
ncbi:hypothetical protein FV139_12350 [Parahaliea maris]|uniref:Uncharacterized protein n=1 Tax=Parahaliea maris TaxID=2716870 RepID=A0A5C8ZZ14_9GAMM|nr:hypothetical protein [Parahaliea maris]TXS92760.1 hypothetical protein FV139_12350 [Parahaliea maris]